MGDGGDSWGLIMVWSVICSFKFTMGPLVIYASSCCVNG